MSSDWLLMLQWTMDLMRQHNCCLAIDGRCASGKTTFAMTLQEELSVNVVHMDDFYLPFIERTEEKMAKPGGHMNFGRLCEEVLIPLKEGHKAIYRPYNCHEGCFLPEQIIDNTKSTIIEGAYSCHPILREMYDMTIFMDISPKKQQQRLKERNPKSWRMFDEVWIPREEYYFSACSVPEHCDLIFRCE